MQQHALLWVHHGCLLVANSKEQRIETLDTVYSGEESPRLTQVAGISLEGNAVLVDICLTPAKPWNLIHSIDRASLRSAWQVCSHRASLSAQMRDILALRSRSKGASVKSQLARCL
jgi:hypothetical protein